MLRFIRRRKNKEDVASQATAEPATSQPAEANLEGIVAEPVKIPDSGVRQEAGGTEPGDQRPSTAEASATQAQTTGADSAPGKPEDGEQEEKSGFFRRLANKLGKTGSALGDGIGQILLGKKEIDDDLLEEIETQLLVADLGVETTQKIIAALSAAIERDALIDPAQLHRQLKHELKQVLGAQDRELAIDANCAPFVVLVVGVNGAGKTTTIGKLAKKLQANGFSVALAAGDTFRAAAVEQLQVWGERNNIDVIAQHTGADSASVIYDGLQASKARDIDVLLADTAGRLHNKDNLMEELKKVVRVMKKIDASAPHEVLLVLDATTGQNAIAQAKTFQQAVGVTGIAITKLDGTAKGGVVFAISDQLGLPIRFIGVGEKIEDLRPFDPDEFVDALFEGVELQ